MGYYTSYELTSYGYSVNTKAQTTRTLDKNLAELVDKEVEKMNVFEDGENGTYYTYAKWYSWEDDMLLLSKRIPNVLFCLHGDGENSGDLWEAWFLNGKVQHCEARIIYDDFCESKLTEPRHPIEPSGSYSYE